MELYPPPTMRKFAQVIATERLSLEEFCAHSRLAPPSEDLDVARRGICAVLATICWFRTLQLRTGGDSPHAIGRAVEPEASWEGKDGERFHRNKWPKYARAEHRPTAALIAKAERRFPGSARAIETVLWKLLTQPPGDLHEVVGLRCQLSTDMRALVEHWSPKVQRHKNKAITGFAAALERRLSLDALAVMVLECLEARLSGQSELACSWVRQIYRCLLIMGPDLCAQGIARPLFDLLELRILRHVSHQGWAYFFPSELYIESVSVISNALWHIEGIPFSAMTTSQKRELTQEFLDGQFGWDLRYLLNPFRHPTSSVSGQDAQTCRTQFNLFVWAWNMRRSYSPHPQFPPEEAFEGTDLWAINPEQLQASRPD